MKNRSARLVLTLAFLCACASLPDSKPPRAPEFARFSSSGFTNFETEPVRPLALSRDGRYLYALNTAGDRLEIFDTEGEIPRPVGETTVGLRPVALALRGDQAWVVNHLSDSVSVVELRNPRRPRVIHTLAVGDEPRGIVVAGPDHDRVFVAAAKRGDSLLPGIGRAELWIFDAERPRRAPERLTLFGLKPRALAASADGRYVYAAVFLSGNGTTTVSGEDAVRLGRARRFFLDAVPYSAVPKQGAIVRRTARGWRDYDDRDWSPAVPFDLPDEDVFVIDASGAARLARTISGVGTVLFNMAVEPVGGEVWVSNTEALNFTPYESRLRGNFARNRITRIRPDRGYDAEAFDLNPHIDRAAPGPLVREASLAQPSDTRPVTPLARELYYGFRYRDGSDGRTAADHLRAFD